MRKKFFGKLLWIEAVFVSCLFHPFELFLVQGGYPLNAEEAQQPLELCLLVVVGVQHEVVEPGHVHVALQLLPGRER